MSESCHTKQRLAHALKTLLHRKPLSKISISELCAQCEMSRKSFYYHFRDKYDLVIWIFETEFLSSLNAADMHSEWDFLLNLCKYFKDNQIFYRRVLETDGQNSLAEYLRALMYPIVSHLMPDLSADSTLLQFYVHFYSDAFLSSVRRWLNDEPKLDAQTFVSLLGKCIASPV